MVDGIILREKFAKGNTGKKRRKRPGQKQGHEGITRAVPDKIDEVIEETLLKCPQCEHALGEAVKVKSDFFSVYLKLPYKMQKCLVHLLREFHDCAKTDRTAEFIKAYRKIKRLIKDVRRLRERHNQIPSGEYVRLRLRLEERLFDFTVTAYTNKNLQRLSKRFVQSWLDMFRFLKYPSLAWNNNLAKRMIRPNAIYRNRSFGNRSDRGVEAHGTIMSLMQTLRLQGKNVAENLRHAFLRHRQGFLR